MFVAPQIIGSCCAKDSVESVEQPWRRYDVNANQVFAWRKRYRDGTPEPAAPQLVPVIVTPDEAAEAAPEDSDGMIEIVLEGGYRIRVGGGVKSSALRLVLNVLERR